MSCVGIDDGVYKYKTYPLDVLTKYFVIIKLFFLINSLIELL